MPNIALNPMFEQLRGSIGDITYTRAQNGNTTRERVPVANPNTPAQRAARQRFSAASVA